MISAVAWIPKGVAKSMPVMGQLTAEEVQQLQLQRGPDAVEDVCDDSSSEGSEHGSDSENMEDAVQVARRAAAALTVEGGAGPVGGVQTLEAAMRQLDMENYDDSDDEEAVLNRVLGGASTAMYDDEADDPYITLPGADSDEEDLQLKDDDILILAVKNEDDVSHLEVWVYEPADEDSDANLFVHHDVMLPAFPLAVEWMDLNPHSAQQACNMAAVGSMEPTIEIWDLDVLDSVEPVATLGGLADSQAAPAAEGTMDTDAAEGQKKAKKKKKKKSKAAFKEGSHEDAVLGLAWNSEYRNVLASASADTTVKVWDVATQSCQHTLRVHSDKAQAVRWNPNEHAVLLTGGFDRVATTVDVRSPSGEPQRFPLSADVEAVCWDPAISSRFYVSAEDGIVTAFDCRSATPSQALFRLQAHDKAACALDVCPAAPNMLMSASTDKTVKLWNVREGTPGLLATQDLQVGAVFAARFCPEAPWLLVAGGSKGTAAVWDVSSSADVRMVFGKELQQWQRKSHTNGVQTEP